jgi:alpha-mannosidase
MPHEGSWHDADLVAVAERYRHPLVHRWATGEVDVRSSQAEGLSVQGAGVVMTSLRRRGDWLELRLVAQSPQATTALVGTTGAPVTTARSCDLLGREADALPVEDGVLRLPMRPWQIVTVQLRKA